VSAEQNIFRCYELRVVGYAYHETTSRFIWYGFWITDDVEYVTTFWICLFIISILALSPSSRALKRWTSRFYFL